jgi:sterol desaturase/sphingolipid hydroxylase (fatty acid hydroxylase superfamily)
MLPWMDRLFGTYYLPARQWPSAYGIEAKLPTGLAAQLLYPLRPPLPPSLPKPVPSAR